MASGWGLSCGPPDLAPASLWPPHNSPLPLTPQPRQAFCAAPTAPGSPSSRDPSTCSSLPNAIPLTGFYFGFRFHLPSHFLWEYFSGHFPQPSCSLRPGSEWFVWSSVTCTSLPPLSGPSAMWWNVLLVGFSLHCDLLEDEHHVLVTSVSSNLKLVPGT